jgi:kinetochore protein Mis12/MTW1
MHETGEKAFNIYEYETQFLGFTPISFVDSVITAVNDIFYEIIEDVYKTLEKRGYPPEKLTKELSEVLAIIYDTINEEFDIFEMYCYRNIFEIPEFVIIPSDQCIEVSDQEKYLNFLNLDKVITDMENRIQAINKANRQLLLSVKSLDLKLRSLEGVDAVVENIVKECSVNYGSL